MKALSIKQPWAWLIVNGYKDIENRGWYLSQKGIWPEHLPKRIYVHAGKTTDDDAMLALSNEGFPWMTDDQYIAVIGATLVLGCIVGEVDITGCVEKSDSPWFVGPYGFTLANPVDYDKPIPYRGQLGFFEVQL
jgi:hypothetical protein